jgi:hypothetical protein
VTWDGSKGGEFWRTKEKKRKRRKEDETRSFLKKNRKSWKDLR